MGEKRIVKLHFRSAIHLGSDIAGVGLEDTQLTAHSDTLFSCLINAYAQLHAGKSRAVEELLEPFLDGNPIFRISSAFPFRIPESGLDYYLPAPLVDLPRFFDPTHGRRIKQEYAKTVSNTPLVHISTFKKWLGHQGTLTRIGKNDLENETKDISRLSTRSIRPQHARDRLTDATTIYHTGLVDFHGRSGLYFLVELNDEDILDWGMFKDILTEAGINGLGGRRSHGNGIFKVTDDTISKLSHDWQELFDLPKQNGFVNLSLYYPEITKEFANLNPVAYQLVPRQGWCYSSVVPSQMKRRTVTMFSEGSVFRNEPMGTLADVTPDGFSAHNVYRYGIPIKLPINILEKEDDIS